MHFVHKSEGSRHEALGTDRVAFGAGCGHGVEQYEGRGHVCGLFG